MKTFDEFITETVGAGGVAYEKKVEVVVDRLQREFSNFKKRETAGGAFSSAGSGDMTFEVDGKVFNMEIKMDGNAQMGGTSINFDRDEDEEPDVFPNRLIDRFVFDKIKEEDRELFMKALKPKMKYMDAFIDHLKSLPDPIYQNITGFPISILVKDWNQLVKDGYLVPLNGKISFDAKFIRDHYQKKNVDYIQIGGIGLLHTGKDPMRLGVPMLDGAINIEMRLGAAGSGGKAYKSANYRVQGRLDLKSGGIKSSITLDNYESAVKGFAKYLKKGSAHGSTKLNADDAYAGLNPQGMGLDKPTKNSVRYESFSGMMTMIGSVVTTPLTGAAIIALENKAKKFLSGLSKKLKKLSAQKKRDIDEFEKWFNTQMKNANKPSVYESFMAQPLSENVTIAEMQQGIAYLIVLIKEHEKLAYEAKKAKDMVGYQKHRDHVMEFSHDITTAKNMILRAMRSSNPV